MPANKVFHFQNKKFSAALPGAVAFLWLTLAVASCNQGNSSRQQTASDTSLSEADSLLLEKFGDSELKTNWKKLAIPADSIYDGGPAKNDIPAIDFPEFLSVQEAAKFLTPPDFGLLLDWKGIQKFYPFRILNWHEIVNDRMAEHPVAVTFCPLCGSAIVFDALVDGDTLLFGVSGKLFESNLLMFDQRSESLWSQATGECVAGDQLGKKLLLINSVVISFEEIVADYPAAQVLSMQTGFDRNYFEHPYSEYNSSDELYFPVSKSSPLFSNKEEMYVVEIGGITVAFHWLELLKAERATMKTPEGTVEVSVKKFVPYATRKETGEPLNGYFSYWFSWFASRSDQGLIWKK